MAHRLVDLLRHGEVQGGPCFRGRRDDPLSVEGWAQLEAATAVDAAPKRSSWDRILSSPALRCSAFASRLGQRLRVEVEYDDCFRERAFGAWEGLRADQIPLEELSSFWANPLGYDPPGAEPFADFRERVVAGWRAVVAGDDGHLLIVTHGGVIRVILGEVLGVAAERLILLEVPPACRSRLRLPVGGGRPSLIAHGEAPRP